jgi:hypothetical protein
LGTALFLVTIVFVSICREAFLSPLFGLMLLCGTYIRHGLVPIGNIVIALRQVALDMNSHAGRSA